MGYPVDQATLAAEEDRLKLKEVVGASIDGSAGTAGKTQLKGKSQTKEEQEMLLEKASKHASEVKKEAVTQAGFVDFSKSVEDQAQLDDGVDDVRKSVLKFPTPCSNC